MSRTLPCIRCGSAIWDHLDYCNSCAPFIRYYMNKHTGSVDTRDGWYYQDEFTGELLNAVDRGEVFEVVKDKNGDWIEPPENN